MQDKFIDLCVDDNHSAYGNHTMPQKAQQFFDHLKKLDFRFETQCLDMPARTTCGDDSAEFDKNSLEALQTADTEMGKDLDAIFDLMNGRAKDQFKLEQVIIEHQWNDRAKKFDEIER